MKLPPELIQRFTQVIVPKEQESNGTTVFGTAKVIENNVLVHFDGATEGLYTPVEFAANIVDGDRVRVELKDRRATIISNLSPSGSEPPGYQQLVANVSNHISNETIHLSDDDVAAIEKVEDAINTIDEALFDSTTDPNLITTGIVKDLKGYIVGIVYPVGSVYAAFGTNISSPAITIGGTWESIIDHDQDDGTPYWHVWRKTSNEGGGGGGGGDSSGGIEIMTQDDIDAIFGGNQNG